MIVRAATVGLLNPVFGERRPSIRGFRSSVSSRLGDPTGRYSGLSRTASATQEWALGAIWLLMTRYGGFPCFLVGSSHYLQQLQPNGKTRMVDETHVLSSGFGAGRNLLRPIARVIEKWPTHPTLCFTFPPDSFSISVDCPPAVARPVPKSSNCLEQQLHTLFAARVSGEYSLHYPGRNSALGWCCLFGRFDVGQ